jgi:hypothetical protein
MDKCFLFKLFPKLVGHGDLERERGGRRWRFKIIKWLEFELKGPYSTIALRNK